MQPALEPQESEDVDEEEVKANRTRKYLVMNLLDSEKCYFDCISMLVKVTTICVLFVDVLVYDRMEFSQFHKCLNFNKHKMAPQFVYEESELLFFIVTQAGCAPVQRFWTKME